MTSKAIGILACAALLGACATVDLNSVGGMPSSQAEAEAPITSVVERAVSRMNAAYAERNFAPVSERNNMAMAADILMNGLSSQTASSVVETSYADRDLPRATILSDIAIARHHVDQTTRAANVYLETAPSDDELTDELAQLEGALLYSERARLEFDRALSHGIEHAKVEHAMVDRGVAEHGTTDGELADLQHSIDGLRSITDEFGIRVRLRRMERLAESGPAS